MELKYKYFISLAHKINLTKNLVFKTAKFYPLNLINSNVQRKNDSGRKQAEKIIAWFRHLSTTSDLSYILEI